ncbi:MAG: CHASE2 domain-containing protein [Pseudobdellovibrionaceae bacterium]|nr:CHASE2 domain-containing protein [Bdellovibrionales bacterium]USN48888.1 MAG: CHASE2 domain-containing protein [Pseudobdellovibrionaceae bacterium]
MKTLKQQLLRSIEQLKALVGRKKDLWLRAGLCLATGLALVMAEHDDGYDLRFQLRGPQKIDNNILLISVPQDDWLNLLGRKQSWIRPLRELVQLSDSFYWEPDLWHHFLETLLAQDPKAIGISFYFGNETRETYTETYHSEVFDNPRVIWASRLDRDGRLLYSAFSGSLGQGTGLNELMTDNDGVFRRFVSPLVQIRHLALRLTDLVSPAQDSTTPWLAGVERVINFRGPRGTYPQLTIQQIIDGDFSVEQLRGKIILIGGTNDEDHQLLTPLGKMSDTEALANIVDSLKNDRWIERLPLEWSLILLFAILLLSIRIMNSYPQSVALVLFFWLGMAFTVFSVWLFDTYNFWIPTTPVLVQLGVTYIVFLSYQLTVSDYEKWQLELETNKLLEVEQLKQNFVSLFSHDLKTPLAKIQAICDRLLSQPLDTKIGQDIQSLRDESVELHHYIQNILKLSRVEAREFRLNRNAEDLNEIVETVSQKLAPLAAAKSITLQLRLEPLFLIDIDGQLLLEVILNLVENAIKYTPEDGHVIISTSEVDQQVVLVVEDDGPGIPEREQNRVFEKFYRTSREVDTTKGSGLGLYLVKFFVELHGGSVFLECPETGGTKIGFSLPVDVEAEEKEQFDEQ